jgi:hypothetical protein
MWLRERCSPSWPKDRLHDSDVAVFVALLLADEYYAAIMNGTYTGAGPQ